MGAYDNEGYRKAFGSATPLTNFSFILRVEGALEIPIKGVRPIVRNNNYERIKEGGINDYVHFKRKPVEEAYTIQIERYLSNSVLDPLANGVELTIPLILQVMKTNSFRNSSDKEDQNTGKVYVFTGCVVMGREYGALDSERSGLATEIITIGYKELFVLPNITSLGGENPSKFDASKNNTARLEQDKKNKEADEKKKKDEEAKRKAYAEQEKKAAEDEKKRREELKKKTDENNKKRQPQTPKKDIEDADNKGTDKTK